jgi:hypothetical protein
MRLGLRLGRVDPSSRANLGDISRGAAFETRTIEPMSPKIANRTLKADVERQSPRKRY